MSIGSNEFKEYNNFDPTPKQVNNNKSSSIQY
jgi:hypothetical protein